VSVYLLVLVLHGPPGPPRGLGPPERPAPVEGPADGIAQSHAHRRACDRLALGNGAELSDALALARAEALDLTSRRVYTPCGAPFVFGSC
jgi:hypothetical protein